MATSKSERLGKANPCKKGKWRLLSEKGINIDMTPVKSGERYFTCGLIERNIGTPLDTGSMLMIAEFDPVHPERLISEPKCLSRPLYGFENYGAYN